MDILVHVTAPATVHHDKRQLGLAQAIIDFHPVSVTNVMSCEDEGSRDNGSLEQDQVMGADEGSRARLETRNPRKRSRAALNPPYRNPFHGARPSSLLQTPLTSTRPRTAPELSPSTIQVPQTLRGLRRVQSESFQSIISRVTNSQETPGLDLDATSDARISPLQNKADIVLSLSQTSLDDEPLAKRQRLQNATVSSPTLLPPPPAVGESFLHDQSPAWDTSPVVSSGPARESQSDTSTATPSQPLENLGHERQFSSQPTPEKPASIVSISSGEPQRHATGDCASTQRPMESRDPDSEMNREAGLPRPFPAIDDLPLEVTAPQPAVGDGTFTSHVTKRLQELIDALPLDRLFKPLKVTRDVKVLERGYWLLEIDIAADDVVKQARTSPSKETAINAYTERFAASTAEERLAKFWQAKESGTMREYDYGLDNEAVGKWTEAEFLAFWNSFSEFVRQGHAGWAVRMVRDDLSPPSSPPSGLGLTRKLRVRIFTWGEVIGHIYLAIWLFSGKTSARIPMKWVAGSDGRAVVEMSGKKKYKGNLRPWVRKGPPTGEGGFWGVADS